MDDILDQLNTVVDFLNVRLEGNLFYSNSDSVRSKLNPVFQEKRDAFALFCTESQAVVEIGFNAGHSALLGLSTNDSLIYYSIDIGHHIYVSKCYDVLKRIFGNRINLQIGNSVDVVPRMKELYPELNYTNVGWVIDGSHEEDYCRQDIDNVLLLANVGEVILIDDTDMEAIREIVESYSDRIKIVKDLGNATYCVKL